MTERSDVERLPTVSALREHPKAIILLEWDGDDPKDGVLGFDWFDNQDALERHYTKTATWAQEDVAEYGDNYYLIAEVADTMADPMIFGRFDVFGSDHDKAVAVGEDIKDALDALVIPDPKPREKSATTRKVKPKVKGRKPSPAGKALKEAVEAAPEVEDEKPKGNAQAERLRKRLAAKAEREAQAEQAVDEAEVAMSLAPAFKRLRKNIRRV